jgi:DHA2 family multidrug resistance protein-like MFS transporter
MSSTIEPRAVQLRATPAQPQQVAAVDARHRTAIGARAPRAGAREWIALAVLLLPVLLVAVDATVLSFALPAISEALNPTGTQLLWMIDIYPLVLAGLLVSMGSFADRVGRRRLLLIGSVGFAVVSAIAAYAPSAEALIASRAALGFFGAMLMPSTLSLLRNVFVDRQQRRLAIAIWAAGFSGGAALGPIVGGFLLEHYWWGSVFLMAVPVLVLLLILAPIFVPESKDPTPGPVDPISIGLSLITMAPIVYAIKSIAHDGFTQLSITLIAVGLVAGTAFVRRQLNRPQPMLDVRLFARSSFSGAVLANLLSVFSLVGFLFFVSQHLQLVLGESPMRAGLILLPGLVVTIVAGLAVVPLVRRVSPRTVVAGGLLISAAGYVAVLLGAHQASAGALALAFVLLSLGIGAAETISNDVIISRVPADTAGAASAISETAYEIGAVLGTAVLGGILTASYSARVVLPAGLSPADATSAAETLGGATAVASHLPQPRATELLTSAQQAFGGGVGVTSVIAVVLMVAASVLVWVTLRGKGAEG